MRIDVLAPGIVMVPDAHKDGLDDDQLYLIFSDDRLTAEIKIGPNLTDAVRGVTVETKDLMDALTVVGIPTAAKGVR